MFSPKATFAPTTGIYLSPLQGAPVSSDDDSIDVGRQSQLSPGYMLRLRRQPEHSLAL
ncbi:hypothetical protein CONPUDRAFT_81123 [Coniophora puteana RWD-64-598 SS2]|uniref:Uncharacterized protein n=1 Tax=Coniophora puteana (strain RWD-64-598) TaxID=741705 RepID=A0A5M3MVI6_CONPW|nr:uncharacterized protein CONPUDRAFT_81123 [Coniophora puteana RWD-64-598 SS2]EIW83027.1 hypothetical protein CONPUDRAFT_81123 [Coniophora puteana RWD-64-598 SS2]